MYSGKLQKTLFKRGKKFQVKKRRKKSLNLKGEKGVGGKKMRKDDDDKYRGGEIIPGLEKRKKLGGGKKGGGARLTKKIPGRNKERGNKSESIQT